MPIFKPKQNALYYNMRESNYWIFIIILLEFVTSMFASCPSTNLLAANNMKMLSMSLNGTAKDCTWIINPKFHSVYYLELKWEFFDIQSKTEACEESFVEIKITKRNSSLGRLCNTAVKKGVPFTIYSFDGHATIRLKTNGKQGRGFSLIYLQKPNTYFFLGNAEKCSNTKFEPITWSANIFSPQWPKNYPAYSCNYYIDAFRYKQIRLIFMDVDLKSCDLKCSVTTDDHIIVRGTNHPHASHSSLSTIKGPIFESKAPFVITTAYAYIHVEFHSRSLSSKRGFVAGFQMIGENNNRENLDASYKLWHMMAILAASVLFLAAFVYISCRMRKKKRLAQVRQRPELEGQMSVTDHLAAKARKNLQRHDKERDGKL